MNDIEPKIKPLYRDLRGLNIGIYLASVDFDRHCLKHGLETLWQMAIKANADEKRRMFLVQPYGPYNDKENALRILLNLTFKSALNDFFSIVEIILSGFIISLNKIQNFDNIFEDLNLINFPSEKVDELQKIHFEYQAKIGAIEFSKHQIKEKDEEFPQPKIFLESKKTAWIEMIAKADIQSVLEDMINYATVNKEITLMKQIVNLSSRWYSISQSDHNGTVSIDDKSREINKINNSLIDLILNLK